MSLAVTLPETTIALRPGQSALAKVQVTNKSRSDRTVRLDLSGPAASWVRIADATAAEEVSVGSGQTAAVLLSVEPPSGAVAPGQLLPFRVSATAADDVRVAASATGLVVLTTPCVISASLVPESVSSKRLSRHRLHLTTDNPTGVLLTLRANITDGSARVAVDPVALRVEPGGPGSAMVTARAWRPALFRRSHEFDVIWETDGLEGLARGFTRGQLVQQPLLPPVLGVLLAAAVAVVLSLGLIKLVAGVTAEGGKAGRAASAGNPTETPARAGAGAPESPPTRPYALVDLPPQLRGPTSSRAAAEQRAEQVPLRPGLRRRVLAGAQAGTPQGPVWLIVVEGFGKGADVTGYCRTLQRQQFTCLPRV